MVLGTIVAGLVVMKLARIISWLVVAAFLALILNPVVDFFQHRLHLRRSVAILLTFIVGAAVFSAVLYAFIRPIVDQVGHFADNFPRYVEDAKAGRGTVGHLVHKYKIDQYITKNQDKLKAALSGAGKPAASIARKLASTLAAIVTIIVLAFLMLAEGPRMAESGLNALPERYRNRLRKVAADSARAVTGYVAGNLLISLIASVITFVSLWILGVQFRAVLSLWVFFADLIPLVGATLGAIPAVLVTALVSPVKGIILIVIYVAYQQFENHVLQVTIMAKTVRLNPLAVLVSVLIGVELFGFLGALLAIPAAGIIQVVIRDSWDNRRGRMKSEPTIGADETPINGKVGREPAPDVFDVPDVPDVPDEPAPTPAPTPVPAPLAAPPVAPVEATPATLEPS